MRTVGGGNWATLWSLDDPLYFLSHRAQTIVSSKHKLFMYKYLLKKWHFHQPQLNFVFTGSCQLLACQHAKVDCEDMIVNKHQHVSVVSMFAYLSYLYQSITSQNRQHGPCSMLIHTQSRLWVCMRCLYQWMCTPRAWLVHAQSHHCFHTLQGAL